MGPGGPPSSRCEVSPLRPRPPVAPGSPPRPPGETEAGRGSSARAPKRRGGCRTPGAMHRPGPCPHALGSGAGAAAGAPACRSRQPCCRDALETASSTSPQSGSPAPSGGGGAKAKILGTQVLRTRQSLAPQVRIRASSPAGPDLRMPGRGPGQQWRGEAMRKGVGKNPNFPRKLCPASPLLVSKPCKRPSSRWTKRGSSGATEQQVRGEICYMSLAVPTSLAETAKCTLAAGGPQKVPTRPSHSLPSLLVRFV